jgi:hypothetical protein
MFVTSRKIYVLMLCSMQNLPPQKDSPNIPEGKKKYPDNFPKLSRNAKVVKG